MHSKFILFVLLLLIVGCFYQCGSTLYIPKAADTQKTGASLDSLIKGRKMYVRNCGSCHNLHLPEKYTAARWKKELDKMQNRSKINDEEKEIILKYLITKSQL